MIAKFTRDHGSTGPLSTTTHPFMNAKTTLKYEKPQRPSMRIDWGYFYWCSSAYLSLSREILG